MLRELQPLKGFVTLWTGENRMNKGTIYTRSTTEKGWVRINLDEMRVEELACLPFPEPTPPPKSTPLHFTGVAVEKLYADDRIREGLKRLKGKISETEYEAIYCNYIKFMHEDIQEGGSL